MSWKDERDLLIAQTMAFVQSITGKTTGATLPVEPLPSSAPSPSTNSSSPDFPEELAKAERRLEAPSSVALPSCSHSSMRDEIRGRVAAFRAHQQMFNRSRDEYCDAVLAKLRAASASAPDTPLEH